MRIFFCVILMLEMLSADAQHQSVSIVSFGAKIDNRMNTTFIQEAINTVSKKGGGTVVVPAGVFVTGAIELKSNVSLHLEEGAVLLGSDQRADYDAVKKRALIIAVGQHDIGITGKGAIDGNGIALMRNILEGIGNGTITDGKGKLHHPTEDSRTNLFYFEDCIGINIKNINCKDATSWVTHYERCRNVVIDSTRIESVAYWNNDGIDIVDCKNVRITNNYINTADDAICLKSAGRGEYCDSIYVANCTLRSSANAFKLGTGSYGGFKNIRVENLTVFDTYRSAIALEAVDGGFIENISIEKIRATNTGSAIFIRLGHRNKDEVYSSIRNILIRDVTVEVPVDKPDAGYPMEGPFLMYPPNFIAAPGKLQSVSPWNYKEKNPGVRRYLHNVFPSSITGLTGHPVQDVKLENIEVVYHNVADKKRNYFPIDAIDSITEATGDYPEFSMFGEVPVWGFYVRHVDGLQMNNVRLTMKGSDFRVPFLFNDVQGLMLKKLAVKGKTGRPEAVLHHVTRLADSE